MRARTGQRPCRVYLPPCCPISSTSAVPGPAGRSAVSGSSSPIVRVVSALSSRVPGFGGAEPAVADGDPQRLGGAVAIGVGCPEAGPVIGHGSHGSKPGRPVRKPGSYASYAILTILMRRTGPETPPSSAPIRAH
jgi:hypothetical protein